MPRSILPWPRPRAAQPPPGNFPPVCKRTPVALILLWVRREQPPGSRYTRNRGGPKAGQAAGLRRRIVPEAGIEQVVLPDPVNTQVLPGKPLAPEPSLLKQPDGRGIGRNAGG